MCGPQGRFDLGWKFATARTNGDRASFIVKEVVQIETDALPMTVDTTK